MCDEVFVELRHHSRKRRHRVLHLRPRILPDHVLELAVPVMAHRLVMDNQARYSGISPEHLVEEMLRNIAVPG